MEISYSQRDGLIFLKGDETVAKLIDDGLAEEGYTTEKTPNNISFTNNHITIDDK